MSASDPQSSTQTQEFIAQAIASLTAAARTTRTIGQSTPNEHAEPADFGEVACHVITSVAANLGGVETLLAGRSGSWEASYVRQIVQSTAGYEPEELLRYRTEPVRLFIDAEDAFEHFGIDDLYQEASEELNILEVNVSVALFEAVATASERARINELNEHLVPAPLAVQEIDREQAIEAMNERFSIVDEIERRATEAAHPLAAALAAARKDVHALEELYAQDQAAYSSAFLSMLHQALSARRLTCGIEVLDASDEIPEWEPLREELEEYARVFTPLPMTGAAPDWTQGTPADALTRTGLTYIARAQQA